MPSVLVRLSCKARKQRRGCTAENPCPESQQALHAFGWGLPQTLLRAHVRECWLSGPRPTFGGGASRADTVLSAICVHEKGVSLMCRCAFPLHSPAYGVAADWRGAALGAGGLHKRIPHCTGEPTARAMVRDVLCAR